MKAYEQVHNLLTLAGKDCRAAYILAQARDPDSEIVGFHLQQSGEKGLKAWLTLRGETYSRTRELSWNALTTNEHEQARIIGVHSCSFVVDARCDALEVESRILLLWSCIEYLGEEVTQFWTLLELNPFAVQFRYELYDEQPFEWEESYNLVDRLVILVETRLREVEAVE